VPTVAEAFAMAVEQHQTGNLRGAEELYRQILQASPEHAEAHHMLGVMAYQRGDLARAEASIRRAISLNPWAAACYSNLGMVLDALGQALEAADSYQWALRLQPEYAEAHYNLGNLLIHQGKAEQAEHHWREALRIRQDHPLFHYNLANLLYKQGHFGEAAAYYKEALRLKPDYAEAHCNLGNVLECQGRLDDAIDHWQQAIKAKPSLAEAYNNLGNAFLRQGQFDQAECHCRQALDLQSDLAEAWTIIGNVRKHEGQFDEALSFFEKALSLDPQHGESHLNRALLWLLLGDFENGWPEFEWRWQTRGYRRYTFAQPYWDGSSLGKRTLLILGEQGLGDTMQFVRFVSCLERNGGKVIVKCQSGLVPLIVESLGAERVVKDAMPLPAFDVYTAFFSVPGVMEIRLTNVPANVPYLDAAPRLVNHWRKQLGKGQENTECGVRSKESEDKQISHSALPVSHSSSTPHSALRTPHYLVGIAWQGCPSYGFDRERSIPLQDFLPLAKIPGVKLVSLQKGPGMEQLRTEESNLQPAIDAPALDEESGAFMDSAAIMKSLDLVICSDTAIAHLAGGLGVPVWVALSFVPDWRWLLQREDCPWYPTMRLFRQKKYGCWDEVFERIAKELASRVQTCYASG
jgi:Tfp pilus assembly protein PilF